MYTDKRTMCFLKSLIQVSLITWLQKNSGKIGPGKQKFLTLFPMQCRIPLLLQAQTTNAGKQHCLWFSEHW